MKFVPALVFLGFFGIPEPIYAQSPSSSTHLGGRLFYREICDVLREKPADKMDLLIKPLVTGPNEVTVSRWRIKADGQHLNLLDKDGTQIDRISVSLPEGGTPIGLFRHKGQAVIVLATQTSYRVDLLREVNNLSFDGKTPFPTLFGTVCSWTDQFRGVCPPASVSFSSELKLGFTSGYDRWGQYRSYAVRGNRFQRLGWTDHAYDIRGHGLVALKYKSQRYFLFDGTRFNPCAP